VQVPAAGDREALAKLKCKLDLVLIDAPCTGSGVWRRRPDAKWRLSPQMLEARRAEQATVLNEGAALVKPGGRLAYITCSVLPSENRDQVDAFLARHPDFKLIPWSELWAEALPAVPAIPSADASAETLQMTPLDHGTDGFFVAVMQHSG
jgi:16S rRNA (cytosine967-C5)-methyltransferase